ncbi:MAG: 30S ribosomal protein S8e [Candidatus Aenigmarchaeota archaeon]|nr:30S ribosomal protein S8e [Candidatus Aenigmarchaeota archaeon]
MTQWQLSSRKKTTGGFIKKHGKKNRYERGRDYLPARVGEPKIKEKRSAGGNKKLVALSTNTANVSVAGRHQLAKILSVVENTADSQFVRRNIITCGAIIQTELGKARVTSRPGQTGVVNAVLVEEKNK